MASSGGVKSKAWLQAELGKALSGWDEAMMQFLVEAVASSTKRSDVDEVVQNFLPGEPAAISIINTYFGTGGSSSASSARNPQQPAAQELSPEGWRQYNKATDGKDLPEYKAAKASEATPPRTSGSERQAPAQPAKVLGMFKEGGRLRPSTGTGVNKRREDQPVAAAALERPVVNCLGCGKIYDCRNVTSDITRFLDKGGTCTYCGDKVGLTYQERAAQLSQADASSSAEGADGGANGSSEASKVAAAAAAAVEFKNRLVEYDRNSSRRTTVIDDQSDYFEIDTNAWLTDQERSELRRRRQLEEEAAAAKKNRMTVTIDLIGRKVLVPDTAVDQSKAGFETSTNMATARAEAQAAAAAAVAAAATDFGTSTVARKQSEVQTKATAEAVLKAAEALRTMKMTINPHLASAFLPSSSSGAGKDAGASTSNGASSSKVPGAQAGASAAPTAKGKAGKAAGTTHKQQGASPSSSAGTSGSGPSQQRFGANPKPRKQERLQGDLFSEFEEFGLEVLYEDALAAAAAAEASKPFDICEPQVSAGGAAPLRVAKPATMASRLQASIPSSSARHDGSGLPKGMVLLKGYLTVAQQAALVSELRALGMGPGGFYTPSYSSGGQLHLRMMCLGWHWEPRSHSYEPVRSSFDGAPPPSIPDSLHQLMPGIISAANAAGGYTQPGPFKPDVCLVNFYEGTGKLGYHQDKDESSESLAKGLPVVSISIGDAADMTFGQSPDETAASSVRLESGDVLVFGGPARMLYHAVPHIHAGTAPHEVLQATGLRPGRINLTLRQIWL